MNQAVITTYTCKGKCIPFKIIANGYKTGAKRCQSCGIMLKYDGIWCPCCGQKLRTRARNPRQAREVKRY